jgi:alkylation response protein AidB-like acyl-CoA dehydrogenase
LNFEFSEECQAIATQLRRVLAKVCAMDEVKRCLDKACASEVTWRALADLGVLGAAVPERWGGSGLSALELAACAEEIGRACAPVPMLSSVYLATEALLMANNSSLSERWLPQLARGKLAGSVALAAGTLRCKGDRVTGFLPRVPAGFVAAFVVASCDGVLLCVDLTAGGVGRRALRVLDPGAPLAHIDLDSVPATVLGEAAVFNTLIDRAATLLAFEQLGGAERALEMARDYALQRRTFGRFVGSYQAIKHKLADMWVKNELARGHAYHAAWALAHSPRALPLAAAGARVAASAAFEFASQENVQVHGGVGYTWEADCHPLYKRALSTSLALGAPSVWKRRIVNGLATARGSHDEL